MIDYEKELNKDQLDVVYNAEGACLVLSGPGSGKTRTLVYRTVYLLQSGIAPENILLLTFTKKAAKEMLTRISQKYSNAKVCGGTFHHMGNLFLRKYAKEVGYDANFLIIDQEDSKSILSSILKNRRDKIDLRAPVVSTIISLALNSKKEISQIIEENFSYIENDTILEIESVAKEYQKRKRENNLMDYDDLLLNWLKILSNKEICDYLSSQYKYIMVDEYQDTNALQDEIVKKMSKVHNNVLAVGDDSQSIFSFRAADVSNILNFSKSYPKAKLFKLEINYRSTPEILDMANEVIKNNQMRFEKKLRSIIKQGEYPFIVPLEDPFSQAKFIISKISDLKQSGVPLSEIAVLFRAHYHSAELELELSKRKVPYIMRGGIRFFEQAHIKDVAAFLRIIANFKDETSWRRILSRLKGVGQKYSENIIKEVLNRKCLKQILKDREEISSIVSNKAKDSVLFIFNLIEKAITDTSKAVDVFMLQFYTDYIKNNFDNAKDRINDINRFSELSKQYNSLEEMISEFSLSEEFSGEFGGDYKEYITLSTVHQAKGLEWSTVFVISLKEGEFPYIKALEEGSLEEERRLFYVALTRCKKNLFLTYPIHSFRGNNSLNPSRFLKEAENNPFFTEEEIIEEDDWEYF